MAPENPARTRTAASGFTLVEVMVSLGITMVIMAAAMAALGDAVRAADSATLITGLNGSLRTGMDLMVGDLLQAGQGLPSGRVIQIPSGAGSQPIRLPGPPATAYRYTGPSFCPPPGALCAQMTAVIPGPSRGPVVDVQPTDMITTITVDGAFDTVRLTAFAASGDRITIETVGPDNLAGTADDINITNGGQDDLRPGDLLMLSKGSASTLVQVSIVAGQDVTFAEPDSLLLNQTAAATGTALVLRDATAPPEVATGGFMPTSVSRIRMISYYIDATTDPVHPRLVRRINNGRGPVAAGTFDNLTGTVVAFDIEGLLITYDMADGLTSGIRMTAVDLQGGGACGVVACSPGLIRKVNITLSGRSRLPERVSQKFFRTRLSTQVSLRSLSFVDRYR